MTSAASWEEQVRRKRERLSGAIPEPWRLVDAPTPEQCPNVLGWPRKVLTDEEMTITESTPVAILGNIHASTWSTEQVARAFCHRAAVAHQLVNCITEALFDQAIAVARDLDEHFRRTGSIKGPLHGLPMSFMDRFRIAGVETAAGFVSWLGPKEPTAAESLLVRHMRSLGAIIICKTNLPQSMLLGNTTNNIIGSTLNPYNRTLSAGGAAGGEGALLAMRGSAFGWSTEIAGSTRIPASLNHLYSLKTSCGRLSKLGIALAGATRPVGDVTVGMMSTDLLSLQHIARLTLGSSTYEEDPDWLDLPWRENMFLKFHKASRRPTFAILNNDGFVQPQPPLRRALTTLTQRLKQRGYEVVEWKPPSHAKATETWFRLIGADGAHEIRKHINDSGEPPVPQLKQWFSEEINPRSLSTRDYWDLCKLRTDYMASYRSYWARSRSLTNSGMPIDGVIMPVTAHAACRENELNYFGYSAIVNLLDFTSVTIPITFADQSRDIRDVHTTMLNATDAQIQLSYDPIHQHGMPVGLQVMCRRIEEEVALALAEIIAEVSGCGAPD